MTPAAIIRDAAADGVSLVLSPAGTVKATGDQAAVSRWLPVLRAHKRDILAALAHPDPLPCGLGGYGAPPGVPPLGDCELARQIRSMPDRVPGEASDLREFFEERAGILEHDAGLSRPDAGLEAARITSTYARNRGYVWTSLRSALSNYPALLAQLPDTLGPVDSLPFGLPTLAVQKSGRVVRQGAFAGPHEVKE